MKARTIKRAAVKHTCTALIIVCLVLVCSEPAEGTPFNAWAVRELIELAIIALAAQPLNRILAVEARAERIRETINESK